MDDYSPWMDAAQGVDQIGGTFNNLVMNMARMKYGNNMRQQQAQAAMINAMSQQAARESAMRQDAAQIQRLNAASDLDRATLQSANRLGVAGRPPVDLSQGPTATGAEQLQRGDLIEHALRSAALSGDVSQLMLGQNIPANSMNVNPITGQQTLGRMILGQGETAFDAGHVPVARGAMNLPEGNMPLLPQGGAQMLPGQANVAPSGGMKPTDVARYVEALSEVIYNLSNQTNSPASRQAQSLLIPIMEQMRPVSSSGTTNTPFQVGRFKVIAR